MELTINIHFELDPRKVGRAPLVGIRLYSGGPYITHADPGLAKGPLQFWERSLQSSRFRVFVVPPITLKLRECLDSGGVNGASRDVIFDQHSRVWIVQVRSTFRTHHSHLFSFYKWSEHLFLYYLVRRKHWRRVFASSWKWNIVMVFRSPWFANPAGVFWGCTCLKLDTELRVWKFRNIKHLGSTFHKHLEHTRSLSAHGIYSRGSREPHGP